MAQPDEGDQASHASTASGDPQLTSVVFRDGRRSRQRPKTARVAEGDPCRVDQPELMGSLDESREGNQQLGGMVSVEFAGYRNQRLREVNAHQECGLALSGR